MRSSLLILCSLLLVLSSCGEEATVPAGEVTTTPTDDPGIDRLNALIRDSPREADLYAQRAMLFYGKRDFDSAIANFQQAIQLDSTNVDYHYELSDVYLDYFRSRLALRTLERAAELDPDRLETQLRLAEVRLTLKQYDDALRALNDASRLDPRNPEAFLLISQVYQETGDADRALKAAEEATEIDPDFTDAYLIQGQLRAAKKDPRAEEYFNAALAISPDDAYVRHARADFYRDAGRIEEAIAEYRDLSRRDRQYVAGYFNAGLLLMELDSVEAAYREFDITLKNDPVHVRAYFFRGYASELSGDAEAAKKDYQNALRLAPDYEYALEGLARVE